MVRTGDHFLLFFGGFLLYEWHHGPQFLADHFDRMPLSRLLMALNSGRFCLVFQGSSPLQIYLSGCREYILHPRLRFLIHDTRAGNEVTPLGCIGDGEAHSFETLLIHKIDDQLQLMETLKVGNFFLIACFHQCLKPCFHKGMSAPRTEQPVHRIDRFPFLPGRNVSRIPARPGPTPFAYARATSRAFPVTS